MTYLTAYQIYDLLNRPHPLWLVKIDFSDATLWGADLSRSNLSLASLIRADLSLSNLSASNLSRANLQMANLYEADLTLAVLEGQTWPALT